MPRKLNYVRRKPIDAERFGRMRHRPRERYGGVVSDALSYAGGKIKQLSPALYEYGRRALSPVVAVAKIGGKVVMAPVSAVYSGGKFVTNYVPGARTAMRLASAPIRWAIRNPGDALMLGGTAALAAGVGAGMFENPLGDYAALQRIPWLGPMIKGVAGSYSAATDTGRAGQAIARTGSNLLELGRLGSRALHHARAGNYVKLAGGAIRAGMHGAKVLGNTAGALFYTGKSMGHGLQSAGDLILKPVKEILSPIWDGTKWVYNTYGPTETVNRVLTTAGLMSLPREMASAVAGAGAGIIEGVGGQEGGGTERRPEIVEAPAPKLESEMPYLDAAIDRYVVGPMAEGYKRAYRAIRLNFGGGRGRGPRPTRRLSAGMVRAARAIEAVNGSAGPRPPIRK
jgi:hypothetical protein